MTKCRQRAVAAVAVAFVLLSSGGFGAVLGAGVNDGSRSRRRRISSSSSGRRSILPSQFQQRAKERRRILTAMTGDEGGVAVSSGTKKGLWELPKMLYALRKAAAEHSDSAIADVEAELRRRRPWLAPLADARTCRCVAAGGAAAAGPAVLYYALAAGAVVKGLTSKPARRSLHFWREAGPVIAHYKFLAWWMNRVNKGATPEHRQAAFQALHRRYAPTTLQMMLDLQGLYVKIGQVLSSRPDFVPHQYVECFTTLQDSIPQWPIDQVKRIASASLQKEHGLAFDQAFESIDPVALGSASIGQVHRAVLAEGMEARIPKDEYRGSSYDAGRIVAVKVMHPEAKLRFQHDFQVFRWLCRVALPGWKGFVDELEKRLMMEFDYHNEARSLADARRNLLQSPYRRSAQIPQPYHELSTKNVLVMEMLSGRKMVDDVQSRLTDVLGGDSAMARHLLEARRQQVLVGDTVRDPADKTELLRSTSLGTKLRLLALQRKCTRKVDLLLRIHGRQIFVDGIWNADPHPVCHKVWLCITHL